MLTRGRPLYLSTFGLSLIWLTWAMTSLIAAEPSPSPSPSKQSTSPLDQFEASDLLNAPVDQPPPPPPTTPTPAGTRTQSVVINLINRLVERNVLTKQDASELIQMAEEDAAAAKAEAQAAQAPPPPSDDTVRVT